MTLTQAEDENYGVREAQTVCESAWKMVGALCIEKGYGLPARARFQNHLPSGVQTGRGREATTAAFGRVLSRLGQVGRLWTDPRATLHSGTQVSQAAASLLWTACFLDFRKASV